MFQTPARSSHTLINYWKRCKIDIMITIYYITPFALIIIVDELG